MTLGTRSWSSAAGGVCAANEGWLGLGLSLAEAAIETGTELDMMLAVVVAAAAMGAGIVVVMVDVEPGGLSVLAASPSPSTRLPTVGCEGGGLFSPPLLLRLSSAPSGLERVLGRSSAIRSSPSAGPGSALSITPTRLDSTYQESANVVQFTLQTPLHQLSLHSEKCLIQKLTFDYIDDLTLVRITAEDFLTATATSRS